MCIRDSTLGLAHKRDKDKALYKHGISHNWPGYKTIMGTGYSGKRIPHFSNPSITHTLSNQKTGTRERNNAAVLLANRMNLRDTGEETRACPTGGAQYNHHF